MGDVGDQSLGVAPVDRVMAVDGNNLLMRAVRASEHTLMSSNGVNTGPVVIFIRTLARFTKAVQPTHLVVCWDAGHAYRSAIWGGYKSGRVSRGDRMEDPHDSFGLAKRFLSLAGIHHVLMPGAEADDLIAHYWRHRDPLAKLYIISGDRDLYQLVDDNVEQWRPLNDGAIDVVTKKIVIEQCDCEPENLPVLRALVGDPSDSIPGIPNIGPARAAKILHEAGVDLQHVLEHPRVQGHRDIVLRNHALVNLRECNLGLSFPSPPAFAPVLPEQEASHELLNYFTQWDMQAIRRDYLAGTLWGEPN